MIEKKPNLVADAVGRLVSDFRSKRNMVAVLSSWLRAVKRLDDLVVDTIYAHMLGTAVGAQLDNIGKIVREPRAGKLDDDYRTALGAAIRARASGGQTSDIFDLLDLVLGTAKDFDYVEAPINTFVINVTELGPASAEILAGMLARAKPAGHHGTLVSSPLTAAEVLSYGSVYGAPGVGYSSVYSSNVVVAAHARKLSK